jgi:hypothetical protein
LKRPSCWARLDSRDYDSTRHVDAFDDAGADAAVAQRFGPAMDADSPPPFARGIGEPLCVDAHQRLQPLQRIARALRDRIEHCLAAMPVIGERLDEIVLALEVLK